MRSAFFSVQTAIVCTLFYFKEKITMIYSLKTSFSKADIHFDEVYMSFIKAHKLDGEDFIKELSPYKSLDVFAFFTNKRIIFIRTTDNVATFKNPWEIEFLPYKNIQRTNWLESKLPVSYKLEIFLHDNISFSFTSTDLSEALLLSKIIGKHAS